MKFFTYILYSSCADKFYTGHSQDIESRLVKHNRGDVKSTKGSAPWELKYYEVFQTRSEAYKRECEIKSKKSRKYILELIENSKV